MALKIRHRHRFGASPPYGLIEWDEWQIVDGRKIVGRYDTERQASEAMALLLSKRNNDAPARRNK